MERLGQNAVESLFLRYPALSAEQYGEIFQEIVAAVAERLTEDPEAGSVLRGRTFARVLH